MLYFLLIYTSYHDIYYDKEYIYIKEYYKKEFQKFPIEDIEYIDHIRRIPIDTIKINDNRYRFTVSIWLYYKKDILTYIKEEAVK